MSPLWRDELHITLGPDRAAMVRFGRGMRPAVTARREIACAAPALDEAPWAKAIESLEAGLHGIADGKCDVRVVLSNHFVRYALVPWSEQISDREEEQAFVRHCFAQTYGENAQRWAVRMSPCGYGETQVASAIDQALLEGLERVFRPHGARLVSVQPLFVTLFNQWRRQLPPSVAWFVVAEPGRLCVSRLQHGAWRTLRAVKTGEDWQETLTRLLEREYLISESGAERGEVYLCGPDASGEADLPGWMVHTLRAAPDTGRVPEIILQRA